MKTIYPDKPIFDYDSWAKYITQEFNETLGYVVTYNKESTK